MASRWWPSQYVLTWRKDKVLSPALFFPDLRIKLKGTAHARQVVYHGAKQYVFESWGVTYHRIANYHWIINLYKTY
jgi:hypothetical protein